MNFTGSGMSWTLGPRGASVSIGRRGTYINAGIPGTGLYSRERVGRPAPDSNRTYPGTTLDIRVGVDDDGTVRFEDVDGNPLPERVIKMAKKQQAGAIRDLIDRKCGEINALVESLGEIHLYTPSPDQKPCYEPREFEMPSPVAPTQRKSGLVGMLFKSRRERIEMENAELIRQFEASKAEWLEEKIRFEEHERQRRDLIERGIYADVDLMQEFLEERLQDITWPRETLLSMEVGDDGRVVMVDVDLPEIEEMPTRIASVPQRGFRLAVKDMTAAQTQRLYMRHVHGIGFRILGEVFAALPTAQSVTLSAYSQRPDRATGQITDQYLYSVHADRTSWSRIDFASLDNVDVVEAFTQFDLRRKMTQTGSFKPVVPFGADA